MIREALITPASTCKRSFLLFFNSVRESPSVGNLRLNDKNIRAALLESLTAQPIKPRAVMEELRVHNGSAIADVVALFEEAHCFEIKGSTDKITRISIQSTYYNAAFRRITLVTTASNLKRAREIAPRFWGIMIATAATGGIRFENKRKAKLNPYFVKELALLTLWKSEMLTLVPQKENRRHPRDILAQMISSARRKAELSTQICNLLLHRHATVFK